jgi:hypothetical protein
MYTSYTVGLAIARSWQQLVSQIQPEPTTNLSVVGQFDRQFA